jgi:hypothetical protein
VPQLITAPIVLICEGEADCRFFEELRRRPGMGSYVVPRFTVPTRGEGRPERIGGVTRFPDMLRLLAIEAGSDPAPEVELRAVVLCADAGADPAAMTRTLTQWAADYGSRLPSIRVIVLPTDGRPGGLETLCLDAARTRKPEFKDCVAAFFACMGTPARTMEKHDKARLACVTAALESDPTWSLQHQFGSGKPCDVLHPAFDGVAEVLRLVVG